MVVYLAYKASKDYNNRGLIPKRLKASGCICICKSFWEVDDEKVKSVLNIVRDNQPILIRRTRDLRKPKFDEKDHLIEFGSLIVAVYNAEKDEKGKIRRLLRKTPYLRLCRSVYAFCQTYSQYDEKSDVLDISWLLTLMREVDVDVKLFPRMNIINADPISILLERVRKRVEHEVNEVIEDYKYLLQKANDKNIDKRSLIEQQKKLHRKFLLIKKKASFYEKWLKIDLTKAKMKIYPVTRKLYVKTR
jgi:hypothetical protein